jgi:hypothetical protein
MDTDSHQTKRPHSIHQTNRPPFFRRLVKVELSGRLIEKILAFEKNSVHSYSSYFLIQIIP